MRRVVRLACVVGVLTVFAGAAGARPRPDRERPLSYNGVVTAVDDESVTVRGFGAQIEWVRGGGGRSFRADDRKSEVNDGPHTVIFLDAGVSTREVRKVRVRRSEFGPEVIKLFPAAGGDPVVVKLAEQPEYEFVARGPLAGGGYKKNLGGPWSYRLSDVRVGDRVAVRGVSWAGGEYVESIGITRRPGGRVPVAPEDVDDPLPDWHPRHHERANAEQEWEENGIPLPKGYHDNKRWIHPAPPPRERTR